PYDNTENDRDALALGRRLRDAGAKVSLAYVRHIQLEAADREALEESDAQSLLAEGAELLGDRDVPRHVVIDASTGEGLLALAEREGADVVVFGSDYRTATGSVQPGNSAHRRLSTRPAPAGGDRVARPAGERGRAVAPDAPRGRRICGSGWPAPRR